MKRPFVLLLTGCLLIAACGSRLPREEIVAGPGGAATIDDRVSGDDGTAGVGDSPLASGGSEDDDPAGRTPQPSSAGTGDSGVDVPADSAGEPMPSGIEAEGEAEGSGSKAPIVIASVGNYSGPVGASEYPGAVAVQAWAQHVNDNGGLNGHPIKLYVADDGSSPSEYQAIIKDMVENKKVLAFVGNMASQTVASGIKYLEEKRVPIIGGDISVAAWFSSPMLFPQGAYTPDYAYQAMALGAQYGKSKKFGLITCVEAPPCREFDQWWFEEGYAKDNGLQPVYKAQVSFTQPDFTAECLGARNAGAGLVSVIADLNTVTRVADSCARQNYHPQFLLLSGVTDGSHAKAATLDGTIGVFFTFPFVADDTDAAREYHEVMTNYAPDQEFNPFAALGWTAAKLFEKVAANDLGNPPSRDRLLENLWAIKDDTLGGLTSPLTFNKDQLPSKPRCAFVGIIDEGRWTAPQGSRPSCRG